MNRMNKKTNVNIAITNFINSSNNNCITTQKIKTLKCELNTLYDYAGVSYIEINKNVYLKILSCNSTYMLKIENANTLGLLW